MAAASKIEWTDASWNPIRARDPATGRVGWHCTHASEGCRFCYAEGFNHRLGTGLPYTAQAGRKVEIYVDPKTLGEPARWARPRRVFVGSMTDLFADFVTEPMLDQVFAGMEAAGHHTYQLLTKRAVNMAQYLHRWVNLHPERDGVPLPNVWCGISAEDQDTLDQRLPLLKSTPAAVRFLSLEPLIGPIDRLDLRGIDQVIVGGESGPKARPLHPDWVRRIHHLCEDQGAAFFFKQWGAWAACQSNDGEWPTDQAHFRRLNLDGTTGPDGWPVQYVGKKHAGHLLDGQIHQAFPGVRA